MTAHLSQPVLVLLSQMTEHLSQLVLVLLSQMTADPSQSYCSVGAPDPDDGRSFTTLL